MSTMKWDWRNVPRKSFAIFLLGVFFIFSTFGFASDSMGMGRQPGLRLLLGVLLSGLFPVGYAASGLVLRNRFWKVFVPLFALQFVVMNFVARWLPSQPLPHQFTTADLTHLDNRLGLDGAGIMLATALGYVCFIYFSVTEGKRYFRVHAEMALATEIHRVLVPAIDTRMGSFEFYGRSLPSGEVGGDLIDVFLDERGWIAYIADVSGHGVAPGVVMGMVKSAARMQLSSGEKNSELLERLNSVLRPIKKPEMFATFAYVAWNGRQLEYSTAGHPAILHYHAATREISELACHNLPLGLLEGQPFASQTVECARDDLFLLLTDGLLETANAADEEFGLSGVKAVMSAQAAGPTDKFFEELLAAAQRHGHPVDDLSVLLVRCR